MLLRLLSWPYLKKHILRWVLTVAGIVLGVAVFVAMHTANRSVHNAFDKTVQRIAGSTQLQVYAGEFGFEEFVLERVQNVPEVAVAVPVIEATVETGIPGQGTILILGIDMTGDRSLRDYELDSAEDSIIEDPLVFLAQPDSLLVTKEFAERNGFAVNTKIPLLTIKGEKQFTIRGIMSSKGMTQAFGGNLAIMDIYAVQQVLGRGPRFDRIDLKAKDGVSLADCRAAVQQALGPGFEVEPPSSRGQHFDALMGAYSTATSLTSLFALIVGMFIIYNSFSIAVTQRRSEIGILRALGATQTQIRRLFLMESAAAGMVGSALGVLAGVGMAFALSVYMGTLTEQVVGVAQRVDELALEPWLILAAVSIGVGTSVVAAWIPARSAARVNPIQALQKGKYQMLSAGESRRRRIAAFVLIAFSGVCLFFSTWKPAFYAGYVSVIMAGLLMTPTLSLVLAKALRPILRRACPAEGTLAADSLIQSPRRTSATVAALMLSLAIVVGFGGFSDSIFDSLNEWIATALNPDFFVGPTANLTNRSTTFPAEVGKEIEAVDGVDMVQLVRDARVIYKGTPVLLVSVENEKLLAKVRRKPLAGDPEQIREMTSSGRGLIVSDGFSALQHVTVGDLVEIPTPSGMLKLTVAGVIRDYSDVQGAIFIDRSVYIKHWNDTTVNVARVYLKPGFDSEEVRKRITAKLEPNYRLLVFTNAQVRDYVLQLTDQWFSMTYNQIVVAVLVAVLGIVNTLTVSITDRRRELGVMQAVGGLRSQIRRTVWLEAISIGIIGLVLGIALGAVNLYYNLGMIKRDLGGLDLDYIYPVGFMTAMIPIILAAAFIAAVGPAESAVRGSLVESLEYE